MVKKLDEICFTQAWVYRGKRGVSSVLVVLRYTGLWGLSFRIVQEARTCRPSLLIVLRLVPDSPTKQNPYAGIIVKSPLASHLAILPSTEYLTLASQ